jgi:hypothetical protein
MTPQRKVTDYFATHEHKAMVAHGLIDGLAGLAIMAMALALYRYLGGESRLGKVMLWASVSAGLVSVGQFVVGELLTYRAAHGSGADNVKTLFKLLKNADTAKIILLAVMIGGASVLALRNAPFPRWFPTSGIVFAPILAISGLAFPFNSDAPYALLEVTLVALLLWVAEVTVIVARRAPHGEPRREAAMLS